MRFFTGLNLKWREYLSERTILYLLEGSGLAAAVAWLFYQSKGAMILLSPLAIPYCLYRLEGDRQKERRILSGQFRELLESVNNALRAGDSPENAFREGYKEMLYEYGEHAPITERMRRVVGGMDNQIPLEKLLTEFASRWDIEEISEFAEVFSIARRSGGNLPVILNRTAELIQDRMEIDTEIDILLSSRKFEQKIMNCVPFFIIFYLGLSTEGFFDVLYHNAAGAAFMTACLAAYLFSILFSDKIMAIEL